MDLEQEETSNEENVENVQEENIENEQEGYSMENALEPDPEMSKPRRRFCTLRMYMAAAARRSSMKKSKHKSGNQERR